MQLYYKLLYMTDQFLSHFYSRKNSNLLRSMNMVYFSDCTSKCFSKNFLSLFNIFHVILWWYFYTLLMVFLKLHFGDFPGGPSSKILQSRAIWVWSWSGKIQLLPGNLAHVPQLDQHSQINIYFTIYFLLLAYRNTIYFT